MRILHFSDVHLSNDKKAATEMLIGKMMDKLKLIIDTPNGKIDLVIFTGDFLDKSGRDDDGNSFVNVYEGLTCFVELVIQPIMELLSLPKDRFIITMGNHEVIRYKLPEEDKQVLIKSVDNFEDFYWRIISKDSIPWIEDFKQFENEFYTGISENHVYTQEQLYSCHKLNIDGQVVNIMSLNTAWATCTRDEYVYIAKNDLLEFEHKVKLTPRATNFIIGHNHYRDVSDKKIHPTLFNCISEFTDVYLCGHTHQGFEYIEESHKGNVFFSVAPSMNRCNIHKPVEDYKNGFMIIDYTPASRSLTSTWYELNENLEFVKRNDYGEAGTYRTNLSSRKKILPLINFLNENQVGEYIQNHKIKEIKDVLLNGPSVIRLSALPGFGKTRLLYETFKHLKADSEKLQRFYYCKSGGELDDVYDEFRALLQSKCNDISTIIIDDCSHELLKKCSDYISNNNYEIKLIVANNQPYDFYRIPGCLDVELLPTDLRNEVNSYIESNIKYNKQESDIISEIQTLADGFPYMALLLVKAYNEYKNIGINDIKQLLERLIEDNSLDNLNYKKALRALALFQPMPSEYENELAYKYVITNNLITHIDSLNEFDLYGLFSKVRGKYNNTLIENTHQWLNVRPYPLAVYLISEWFEEMSTQHLECLMHDLQQQPDNVKRILIEGMSQRLSSMQESEYAKHSIAKLMYIPNSSFCCEKVVCSEMGSRLFLAMSAVNPKAVANCLRYIFSEKDTEWIKSNIKDGIRRNLVCALNKLCFAKESYDDAVVVLAQLAEAENEHWANNSRNEFRQLFHVYLAGTEVDLSRRLKTIEELWNNGYMSLAIGALDSAFLNHHFNRMGGAEKFGWRHREEYVPQNKEIIEYWDGCMALLLSWYEKSRVSISDICKIAESHINDWNSYWLMQKYLFTIINEIAPTLNWQWKKMYELLNQLVRYGGNRYSEEELRTIEGYISKLEPKLFSDTLLYTSRKVFHRKDNVDILTRSHELFEPLAKQFVTKGIYQNSEEVNALLQIKSGMGLFLKELKGYLKEDMLRIFFNHVWDILVKQGDEFDSNFVNGILLCYRDSAVAQEYLQKLEEFGFLKTYSRTMAYIEDGDMTSYSNLLSWYKNNKITYEHIEIYLKYLGGLANEQMSKLLPSLVHEFPNNKESILEFVLNHHFDVDILMDNIHSCMRELLLNVNWVNESGYCKYEVISLVKEYLEKLQDDLDFAIQVNNKIIATLSNGVVHNDEIGDLYCILLQEPYQNVIWDNFVNALSTNKSFLWNIKFSIGSGFSFGAGPLFQFVSDQKIKSLCDTNNDLIHDIANMAPVFKYDETSKIVSLSDFLIWMIDTYGEQRNTLSGISTNMHTMSWTGSPIPLYSDMIRVLTPYISHHNLTVQQWAKQEIEHLEEQIAREKSQDDYMRMHYT